MMSFTHVQMFRMHVSLMEEFKDAVTLWEETLAAGEIVALAHTV